VEIRREKEKRGIGIEELGLRNEDLGMRDWELDRTFTLIYSSVSYYLFLVVLTGLSSNNLEEDVLSLINATAH
jgi:hypothetical protein